MRRFKFRLAPLLELRDYKEREAEAELARKSGAVALLEAGLKENAGLSLEAAKARFRRGARAEDCIAAERYAWRLSAERDRLMKALAAAEFEREKARAAYIEASKEKETLEKLKERAEAAYYKAAGIEEVKFLDDLGAIAAARRSRAREG